MSNDVQTVPQPEPEDQQTVPAAAPVEPAPQQPVADPATVVAEPAQDTEPTNWTDAFARLAEKATPPAQSPEAGAGDGQPATGELPAAQGTGQPAPTPAGTPRELPVDPASPGGPVPDAGIAAPVAGVPAQSPEVQTRIAQLAKEVQTQAATDADAAFLAHRDENGKPTIRQNNGVMGATMMDADIYKQDENGVASFYNPDTGLKFTGDNPRRQAQEWVNDYNDWLKGARETAIAQRTQELATAKQPTIDLIRFEATYDSLDPVRKSMFDSLIADYEVYEGSDIIGYSCDLNKALASVNRQVAAVQAYQAEQNPTASSQQAAPHVQHPTNGQPQVEPAPPVQPSGPAIDMPTGASGAPSGEKPEFKSVGEAMGWLQQQELDKRAGKK